MLNLNEEPGLNCPICESKLNFGDGSYSVCCYFLIIYNSYFKDNIKHYIDDWSFYNHKIIMMPRLIKRGTFKECCKLVRLRAFI